MRMDDRLIPFMLGVVIVIILLLLTLFYNFMPVISIVNEDNVWKSDDESPNKRVNNVFIENDLIRELSSKEVQDKDCQDNKHKNVFIVGFANVPDLNEDILVHLENESIYTVTLPYLNSNGNMIKIHNKSNKTKNVKSLQKIIHNNCEHSRLVTLKPGRTCLFHNKDNHWELFY